MRIYQEEIEEFGNTAESVVQALAQLDKVQVEEEELARHKDLSKGARTCMGGAAAQAGQQTSIEQAAYDMTRGTVTRGVFSGRVTCDYHNHKRELQARIHHCGGHLQELMENGEMERRWIESKMHNFEG